MGFGDASWAYRNRLEVRQQPSGYTITRFRDIDIRTGFETGETVTPDFRAFWPSRIKMQRL